MCHRPHPLVSGNATQSTPSSFSVNYCMQRSLCVHVHEHFSSGSVGTQLVGWRKLWRELGKWKISVTRAAAEDLLLLLLLLLHRFTFYDNPAHCHTVQRHPL